MLNLLKNNDFYLLSKIWHEISKFFIVKRTTNCINKSGQILRIFANETIRELQGFRCGLARGGTEPLGVKTLEIIIC